ncbi:MAG: hypothetical protein AAGF01_30120 [Cyanobacteria bacterium P01_G01_bin.38]
MHSKILLLTALLGSTLSFSLVGCSHGGHAGHNSSSSEATITDAAATDTAGTDTTATDTAANISDPATDHSQHDMATQAGTHGVASNEGADEMHHHKSIEIPTGEPVPTVDLTITPDPVSGWNLQVETTDFAFVPAQVNQKSTPNAGHAHLYINDEKITRLYSEWHYLPSLPPGDHEIVVSLNANGHEALTHNGEPIEAMTMLTVSEE